MVGCLAYHPSSLKAATNGMVQHLQRYVVIVQPTVVF